MRGLSTLKGILRCEAASSLPMPIPGAPDAAFVEQNSGTFEEINALVKQGYLVRTRTDEGTEQARTNDTTRRDLALASGAQIASAPTILCRSPRPGQHFRLGFPTVSRLAVIQ